MTSLSLHDLLPAIDNKRLEYIKYWNFLRALHHRQNKDERVTSRPIELTIDVTTFCQLKCPYCATGQGLVRKMPNMRADFHQQLIEQTGDATFLIWYFSNGEPLLNVNLAEMAKAAKKKDCFSVISTNLSIPLTDKRITELIQSGLGVIQCSIDGTTQQSYEKYRRGGRFELAFSNMVRLIEKKRELGVTYPLIEWRYLVFQHNEAEIETATRIAREIGVDILEFFLGWAPPDRSGDDVAASRAILAAPQGASLDRARAREDRPIRKYLKQHGSPALGGPALVPHQKCDWLYLSAMIYPDGHVAPCCLAFQPSHNFADITASRSFKATLNNGKYKRARQLFCGVPSTGIICENCTHPGQDMQFIGTMRGIIRNAPEWAVSILAQFEDKFFSEADQALMPTEIWAVRECAKTLDLDLAQFLENAKDRPASSGLAGELIAALDGPPRSTPPVELST